MMHLIGRAGHVAGYDVLVSGDTVTVTKGGAVVARHTVPDYRTAFGELSARPGFALGWGRFADGAEVVYCYDRNDGGFGYAVNLGQPDCSEWGYAPFPHEG